MAEVINLNKARKVRARAQREKDAAANRVRFGRPKEEVRREERERERRDQAVENHRIDD